MRIDPTTNPPTQSWYSFINADSNYLNWWSLLLVPYNGYTALIAYGYIRVYGCCDKPGVARYDPTNATMLDIKYFNANYGDFASRSLDRKTEMVVDSNNNLYCVYANSINPDQF